jgi:hypothetical protein
MMSDPNQGITLTKNLKLKTKIKMKKHFLLFIVVASFNCWSQNPATKFSYDKPVLIKYNSQELFVKDTGGRVVAKIDSLGNLKVYDSLKTILILFKTVCHYNECFQQWWPKYFINPKMRE